MADASGNTLWPIVNDEPPLQFLVTLVADRELRGAGSPPGACPDGPPCPPSEAGDYLQVRIDSSIGTPLTLTRRGVSTCAAAERGDQAHRRVEGARVASALTQAWRQGASERRRRA